LINVIATFTWTQGCVFTKNFDKAMMISDAMELGTIQINSAPGRGPDHFPFQVTLRHLFSLTYIIIDSILRYINYITAHEVENSLYKIKV
jgi:acyl-CoA reductase-like NAD-dependent aldehyde dehydrogenase